SFSRTRKGEIEMSIKLLLSVGDVLPMRGLQPGIVVRVKELCGRYVVTDLPAANGGTVELLTTEAMEMAGLPLWPRAEDVLDEPGILRGLRLHPEKRVWVWIAPPSPPPPLPQEKRRDR